MCIDSPVINVPSLLYSVSSKMIQYAPCYCFKFKKRVQISTTEYCSKVPYNHIHPFTSTVGGKKKFVSSQEKFCLDTTNNFQVMILTMSREVLYCP